MRHRVELKRALAAELRADLALVGWFDADADVCTVVTDATRRSSAVVVSVERGEVSEPVLSRQTLSVEVDRLRVMVGVVVEISGLTGTEAEDRCAELCDRIDAVIADSRRIEDAFGARQPAGVAWQLETWRLSSIDGPDTGPFGDQGAAAYATLEVSASVRIRSC